MEKFLVFNNDMPDVNLQATNAAEAVRKAEASLWNQTRSGTTGG